MLRISHFRLPGVELFQAPAHGLDACLGKTTWPTRTAWRGQQQEKYGKQQQPSQRKWSQDHEGQVDVRALHVVAPHPCPLIPPLTRRNTSIIRDPILHDTHARTVRRDTTPSLVYCHVGIAPCCYCVSIPFPTSRASCAPLDVWMPDCLQHLGSSGPTIRMTH